MPIGEQADRAPTDSTSHRRRGHRPEAQLSGATYTAGMQGASVLEDWRGVDVGQIRAQLRLSVKDRVRVMVETANVLLDVQEHARRAREVKAE